MADETSRDAPPRNDLPDDAARDASSGRDGSAAGGPDAPIGVGVMGDAGSAVGPGTDPLPTGSRSTVLVVDDEAVVRALVARSLTLAHFDVATAASGKEALRLVADGRVQPAILVTDIDMPGMNGVELAARLLALRPAIRVVMTTGDAERADSARRHPSIVDAVLLKPIRLDDLLRAVGAATDQTPAR